MFFPKLGKRNHHLPSCCSPKLSFSIPFLFLTFLWLTSPLCWFWHCKTLLIRPGFPDSVHLEHHKPPSLFPLLQILFFPVLYLLQTSCCRLAETFQWVLPQLNKGLIPHLAWLTHWGHSSSQCYCTLPAFHMHQSFPLLKHTNYFFLQGSCSCCCSLALLNAT